MSDTAITRRWIDRALVGAVVGMVALIGLIYATIQSDVKAFDTTQRQHSERITATETEMKTIKVDVQEIKSDVKAILREVKK